MFNRASSLLLSQFRIYFEVMPLIGTAICMAFKKLLKYPFSALTLLIWQKGWHPADNNFSLVKL